MADLFFSSELDFNKTAGEVALPEDPNSWPNEILQEIYKSLPFISDFSPTIVMDRVDGERGYALGHVEVMNKTELQPGTSPDALEAAGVKIARIPIIVRDRKLQPFDVIITSDSKMLPLTENRLRQAIFRPQAFDITSRSPGDMSMIGQLYPPYRQNYGFGGGGSQMSAGMGKTGSVKRLSKSMLENILPTINVSDLHKFAGVVEENRTAFAARPALRASLSKLAKCEPVSLKKTASALPYMIRPSVVQIRKEADGYTVKVASHSFWAVNEYKADRGRIVRDFGTKLALAADLDSSVTAVEGGEAGPPEASGPSAEPISSYGVYRVETMQGESLEGYVIPNLIDLDGTPLPLALFTDNQKAAVQGEIAGQLIAESAPDLHWGDHPRGQGFFARELPDGGVEATIPLEVKATLSDQGEVSFMAQTFDGRPCALLIQPNIQEITLVEDHCLIPEDFRWVSLENAEDVALVGKPDDVGKTAAARRATVGAVELRSSGPSTFSMDGYLVDKIAYDQKEMVGPDEVLFLLGGLGADPNYVKTKMAEAYTWSRPVLVHCPRHLAMPEEVRQEVTKTAREKLAKIPSLRRELWKEAAAIPDPTAVDTVLSLGFINPENLTSYIDGLPILENAQEKLCELLFAARIGLRDIPAGPLEKCIKSLEEVIEGLKLIAFTQN